MIDSNAIREAVDAIADEAHAPARVRAALDARLRHHVQRRLVLRVAGVGVTTVAAGLGGVEAYRLIDGPDATFPEVAGGPGGGWLLAEAHWRPGWLPSRYGQVGIGAVIDGTAAVAVTRTWQPPARPDDQPGPYVSFMTGSSGVYGPVIASSRSEPADVGGVRGELTVYDDGQALLSWQPAGEPKLTLTVGDTDAEAARAVAFRVARSLKRDSRSVAIGPRPGWLPFASLPWMFNVGVTGATWFQSVVVRAGAGELNVAMGPTAGRTFDKERTRGVRVKGVDAWQALDNGALLVPLPDGFDAVVSGIGPDADLVRVADDFDYGPAPDLSWYGTRV